MYIPESPVDSATPFAADMHSLVKLATKFAMKWALNVATIGITLMRSWVSVQLILEGLPVGQVFAAISPQHGVEAAGLFVTVPMQLCFTVKALPNVLRPLREGAARIVVVLLPARSMSEPKSESVFGRAGWLILAGIAGSQLSWPKIVLRRRPSQV